MSFIIVVACVGVLVTFQEMPSLCERRALGYKHSGNIAGAARMGLFATLLRLTGYVLIIVAIVATGLTLAQISR